MTTILGKYINLDVDLRRGGHFPPPEHPSCYTLSRVQWVGDIILASKKITKKLQPENLGGASAPSP